MIIALIILYFLFGSLMFSYWIGLLVQKDILTVGDGNPGGANLWKAAGYQFGIIGIILDFLKGYLPLLLIVHFQIVEVSDLDLILLALAPIAGHAFSPFLHFSGGKAIAVTFGVWSALTYFYASIWYAVILAVFTALLKISKKGGKTTSTEDGVQTTIGFLLLSTYFLFLNVPNYLAFIWFGNLLILVWKNKKEFRELLKYEA